MNLVVLTAAMSSLNSGLYSTGRILRSMAMSGSAPRFTGVMSRSQVPYGGILLTSGIGFLVSVLVLMYADGGAGRTTVLCLPLIAAALVAGWYGVRRRVAGIRDGVDA